ncbi:MAG TPA: YeeE/YedE thiosulfate transporter family protein [Turneriella sp.]|nr:YeeE/YedE thiosulfate transporter family protein [Turneriella sp.]HMY10394.1 YeeE/YedE thiosulfate transporter family protein [Turneriella sp.]HNE18114.1 YeeE/YedE thiosulfate transporter family protein [Turneriella sp.]HNN00336.1 YeeE/YedE thiosulfate transporter family protein [Turneriella sp.]
MTAGYIWPFWLGGLAIAGVSVALVILTGRFLSVTRGYASVCSIFSRMKFFQRPDLGGPFGFRTFFTLGLLAGGAIAAFTTTGWQPTFALGKFDQIWGDNLAVKAGVLIAGGFLWGYGSRMAKGCTSGNSISGLSKGSVASLVATCGFLVAGVAVTFLLAAVSGVK